MSLQPGMHLGRYEIVALLGEGGFANVYEGYQREYDRRVAVKVLHEWLAKDARIVARFREEAIKTFNLQHPNIVRVLDFQEDRGHYFIVMELVNGQSLRQLINARDATDFVHDDVAATRLHDDANAKTQLHQLSSSYQELDLGIISSIFRDVCAALTYAHGEQIIHRDVKPDNILVARDGRALLVDFGIAKAQDEALHLTSTGVRIGSALYMAPEQIRVSGKQESDYRSDIYSLGVTLYEVLTGTPPFVAREAQSIWRMHLEDQPIPPSRQKPDLPERLDAVVLKCLAKDPNDRYQNATDVAQALSDLITPKPITILFSSTPPVTAKKRREEKAKLVCPACGYDFHATDVKAICPACGYEFPAEEGGQAFSQREARASKFLRDLGLSADLSLDVKAYEYDKSIKTPLQAATRHAVEHAKEVFADGVVVLPEESPDLPQKYTDTSAALFDVAALMESQALKEFQVKRTARRYRRQSVHKARALACAVIGKYHTSLAASRENHDEVVKGYEQSVNWYQRAQEHGKQSDEQREALTSRFEAAEMLVKLILDFPPEGQDRLAEQAVRVFDDLPPDFWGAEADKKKANSYRGLYAEKLETIERAKKEIANTQATTLGYGKKWRASDEKSLLAPLRARLNTLFAQQLPSLLPHDAEIHLTLWIGIFLLWLLGRALLPLGSLIRAAHVLALLPMPHFLSPAIGLIGTAISGLLILAPWILGYWGGYGRARPSVKHFNQIDLILSFVAILTLLPWLGLWLYGALLMGLGVIAGRYLDKKRAFKRGDKVGMVIGGALLVLFLLYLVLYAAPLTLVLAALVGLAGWLSGDYLCRLDVTSTALQQINENLSLLEKESTLLVARLLYSVDRDEFVNVEALKSGTEDFRNGLTEIVFDGSTGWTVKGLVMQLKKSTISLLRHGVQEASVRLRKGKDRQQN